MLRPVVSQIEGRLLDASEDGMRLLISRPLEPGTVIQVRSQTRFILAEVRYCSPHTEKFAIGVEIKAVFDLPPSEPQS